MKNSPFSITAPMLYVFMAVICPILILDKFGYIDIEIKPLDFLMVEIKSDYLRPTVIVYALNGALFLLVFWSSYFWTVYDSNPYIHRLLSCLSIVTMALTLPIGSLDINIQNLILAGYLLVSIFFVGLIIELIFFAEYCILGREQAQVLQINRRTFCFDLMVEKIAWWIFFATIIALTCFVYGESKVNLYGATALMCSVFLCVIVQLCARGQLREKRETVRQQIYDFVLRNKCYPANAISQRNNDESAFSYGRKAQNVISEQASIGHSDYINFSEGGISKVKLNTNEKRINFPSVDGANKMNVTRDVFLLPYDLPVTEDMVKKGLDKKDLLSLFNKIVDKDISFNKEFKRYMKEVKKDARFIGIAIYPLTDGYGNALRSNYKSHIKVGVYRSLRYSLPLSKLSEYASDYYKSNAELDITDGSQFFLVIKNAVEKAVNEMALEDDRISGYELAILAVNTGSLNKLKTAIEIDKVHVDIKQEGTKFTLLNLSVANGHYELAKYLLEKGANPNIPNYLGRYPMFFAARYDNPAFIELLLEYGANIEQTDDAGETPLMVAIKHQNIKTIRFLVGKNANVHAKRPDGKSVIDLAREVNPQIVRIITQSEQYKNAPAPAPTPPTLGSKLES